MSVELQWVLLVDVTLLLFRLLYLAHQGLLDSLSLLRHIASLAGGASGRTIFANTCVIRLRGPIACFTEMRTGGAGSGTCDC